MARNDIHCPTNFKPQDYTLEDHFGLVDGENYGRDAIRLYESASRAGNPHPGLNQCDLCGQHFVHGAVLVHTHGDVITVGGICMAGIAGVPALSNGDRLYRAKRAMRNAQRVANLRGMLAANTGLNAALHTDHYISQDLRAKLIEWGTLSEKQVKLAFKLQSGRGEPPAGDGSPRRSRSRMTASESRAPS